VYLWKYLSPKRARIVSDLKVRLTQAVAFNDPFEVVPYMAELVRWHAKDAYLAQFDDGLPQLYDESLRNALSDYHLKLEDLDALLAVAGIPATARELLTPTDLASEMKSYLKLLSRGAIAASVPTFGRSFQQKFGERFGILSLSANPTSLLMWAHYADSHALGDAVEDLVRDVADQGFVIGFRAEHPFFSRTDAVGALGRVLPVQYAESRPAITGL
jgi:hypothetical protein